MAWRAAKSLLTLQTQLKRGAPQTAPALGFVSADEWGLIGDAAHDPTSDHAPHDFPGWGTGIVTAADFPDRPDLGLDARRVLDDIRRSHDARAKYGISHGQMFSSYGVTRNGVYIPPWTWRTYTGSDGHFTHGHLSVVGDARADGTQPWQTLGGPAARSTEDEEMLSIEIKPTGFTSQSTPPVSSGAWPRGAALNIANDTGGKAYAVRAWWSNGKADTPGGPWREVPGWGPGGVRTLQSGEGAAVALPKGCVCVSLLRSAAGGEVYGGHLTASIDFGPIGS